jgi:hypothetical protein
METFCNAARTHLSDFLAPGMLRYLKPGTFAHGVLVALMVLLGTVFLTAHEDAVRPHVGLSGGIRERKPRITTIYSM